MCEACLRSHLCWTFWREKFCYWIKKCKMKLVCCVDTHSSMHIFWFTLLEQLPNGTTGYTFFIEIPDRDTEQTIRVFEVTSSPTGLLLLLFTIVTEAQWQLCHCCRLVVLLVLTKAAVCSCAVQMASLHLSSSSASLVRSVDCDVVRLRLTCVEVSFFLWILLNICVFYLVNMWKKTMWCKLTAKVILTGTVCIVVQYTLQC